MTVKTELLQDCYEFRISDTETTFRIETAITAKGELPQEAVFVFTIVSETDPAGDVFNRVGSPTDLRSLKISRALAITAGATEYLSPTFTVSYPLLEVAIAAKATVASRINEAINTWVSYRNQFEDDGTVPQVFPTVSASYEQGLKDTYTDAKAYRVTKETAASAAAAALTLATTEAANAAALVVIYTTQTDFCTKDRINAWVPLKAKIGTSITIFQQQLSYEKSTFMLLAGIPGSWPPPSPGTLPANLLALYNEIVAISNEIDSYNNVGAPLATTLDTDFTAFCSTASINKVSAVTSKAAKDLAVSNSATAKEEADAELASAVIAEAAALAAVKAVCADYDPSA